MVDIEKGSKKSHEQSWRCNICEKEFKYKNNLKRHKSQIHEGQYKLHECEHCKATFTSLRRLGSHHRKSHPDMYEKYSCTLCDATFFHRNSIYLHMRTFHCEKQKADEIQSYKCDKCHKKYESLKTHNIIWCASLV